MALLGGRGHTAAQMQAWGLVNRVVAGLGVVDEALRWASRVAANSPDAVIVTRAGLLGGWDAEDPRASTRHLDEGLYRQIEGGPTCARASRALPRGGSLCGRTASCRTTAE